MTEVPTAGGMAPRCKEYLDVSDGDLDIVIRTEDYRMERYSRKMPYSMLAYMESAYQFYTQLLKYDGFYLHASAVEVDGKAYLFSGRSGIGKSTHTNLWRSRFGAKARIFNDDKPALRRTKTGWFAYGTPWCGKDGINENRKVRLAGICFLKQASENHIRRLSDKEALANIISQTLRRNIPVESMDLLMSHIDRLIGEIPIYELENIPEPEAAALSYETMLQGAEEIGL